MRPWPFKSHLKKAFLTERLDIYFLEHDVMLASNMLAKSVTKCVLMHVHAHSEG